MKTFLTKLSSSITILTLSFTLWGKPVAQVIEIKGTVFMVAPDGKTSAVKVNQHLEDKAELMVEEGAFINVNDYYNVTYHLIGGAHLKFFDKSVQLKKGKAWIQSMNSRHPLALTTANGHVNFWKSEFIATFDHSTSRSQILVVNGEVEVSNVLDTQMKHAVAAGTFSMIDPEVDNGSPRVPTKVGLASLNKALSEFKQLPTQIKNPTVVAREIASTPTDAPEVKRGEIIFIQSTRMPASVAPLSAHQYFKKLTTKKLVSKHVPIKFYGIGTHSPRIPASIQTEFSEKTELATENGQSFHQYKKQTEGQTKSLKELDSLVEELRNYD